MTKYLSVLFARESDPGYYCSFLPTTTSIVQLITSNNNYRPQIRHRIDGTVSDVEIAIVSIAAKIGKATSCIISIENDA